MREHHSSSSDSGSTWLPGPARFRNTLLLTILFTASLVILAQGIGQRTGITAKDEYHLTFRTALSMMAEDTWLVPHLNGVPRLSKPPMLYWLTRASFELFGVSLTSARIVNTAFAALLVVVVALIGFEYVQAPRFGLAAAVIALSTVGMAVQSRFLMFEIPTTAFSALAFYLMLRWASSSKDVWLVGVAACWSAGFLTKGPAVFVVSGSGLLTLLLTSRDFRALVVRRKWAVAAALGLFLACTAPWFAHVYSTYPEQSMRMLQREIGARNFGNVSLIPVTSPAMLALPWTVPLIGLLIRSGSREPLPRELGEKRRAFAIWLGLSVLPFFFMKAFERYLIGSLIPIALLCGLAVLSPEPRRLRLPARIASVLIVVLSLAGIGFAWWFKTSIGALAVALAALLLYAYVWWEGTQLFRMAMSAALLWMAIFGFLYPTLGMNAMPARILETVQGRKVILYGDQQPALLPIETGRSLLVTPKLSITDVTAVPDCRPLVFAREADAESLERNLRELAVDFERVDAYDTLSSRVSWVRFARTGAGADEWRRAMETRSLDPIKMTVVLYELRPRGCSIP